MGEFRIHFHIEENEICGKHEQSSEDASEEINSLIFPKMEKIGTVRLQTPEIYKITDDHLK